ncbi:leucine-rich repeat-containing protein 4C-like [Daktulosphaira vitifoliae]|uniref:leucine-rich repeat-containing protein 4C-like n=1 Tax=Daktulosphaira vitifoliae TaxID=58002 RepID=UPI0021AA92AE|nr:leucine-rich repeat-containing protein 4C-like [Daktulosphaira vitifoliae]XP_050521901.1 leucine-rich repeat-containing protein 4C-like [Daktulosphaira vitifoliae]XP_050521902.1 leucine-rich repeat-containing protein 4C-like [Daktulosphaira vitifoliae]XP_050521903.1 leucine-rich repeat-containing protein 4C-like [Daktulosphaira vitifoliae]XP_050521904.1 leucine-rich repeat-containing protein 4C-like [Daktulosphaira vitifoliae]XP_050521905.1 leucine-rich repeat-containing protein 4C-like [Da
MIIWRISVILAIFLIIIMVTMIQPTNCTTRKISMLPLPITAGCPVGCSCKWKNGKQTVECINKKVTAITSLDINPETQVLDISDNDLSVTGLPRAVFLTTGLLNLQRIHISRCNMHYIHDQAFRGLTNLVDLDLSSNFLREVPSVAFSECTSLMKLNLAGNPIDRIHAHAFIHLQQLTLLDLSECGLQQLDVGAFEGLHNLDWLKLNNNRLTYVLGYDTLPKRLHGINLYQNNWQCDCHMIDMHRWLFESRVPVTLEPLCTGPNEYIGIPIRVIPVVNLACSPLVYYESQDSATQNVIEGEDVLMRCLILATPAASVHWLFNDKSIDRYNVTEYVTIDGNNTAELRVYNASKEDTGIYTCLAENHAGKATANFTLSVTSRLSNTAGSSPPSSSSTSSSIEGNAGKLSYIAYTATVCSIAIIATVAGFMAVHCNKLSKKDDLSSGSISDKKRSTRVMTSSLGSTIGYRTVNTIEKEPIPTNHEIIETALVMPVEEVDGNPDVVNDVNKKDSSCEEWEIDFNDIVWAESSPTTGYVSIQIPVQCGMGCLGAYYIANTVTETKTIDRKQSRCQRRAILASAATADSVIMYNGYNTLPNSRRSIAFDDTATDIRTTAQGYPAIAPPLSQPKITVDTEIDTITPILSPPLPFRTSIDNDDDSIAL